MTYPTEAGSEPVKKPGPGLALSIITIIVGTIVGIAGLTIAITKTVNAAKGPIYSAPASARQHLSNGTYNIYEAVVSRDSLQPLTGAGISAVTVTGPDGTVISTKTPSTDETLGRNGVEYYAFQQFIAPSSGDYTVKVRGASGEQYFIGHTFGDLVKRAAGWFVMMVLGILIGFIGVVLLIVGIVRRRSARRPAFAGGYIGGPSGGGGYPPAQPGLPPAGWYPDPQVPGSNRYWDGTRWTDQTHTP